MFAMKMERLMSWYIVTSIFFVSVQSASLRKRDTNGDISLHMPRALKEGDNIVVKGTLNSDRKSLTISMVKGTSEGKPDPDNRPCLVKMNFPHGESTKNDITLSSVTGGSPTEEMVQDDIESTELFQGNDLTMNFAIKSNKIEIDLNDIPLNAHANDCRLTEDISFLEINGDISKIEQMQFILG